MTIQEPNTKLTSEKRSRIFKRAHHLVRQMECKDLSEALKRCYAEFKSFVAKEVEAFKCECTKIAHMYFVQPNINIEMQSAYNRGTNLNK